MLLVPASQSFADTADQRAIMAVMRGMFDQPNVDLVIGPIVVEGDFAVADWIQVMWAAELFSERMLVVGR